jgi:hypothetical protein
MDDLSPPEVQEEEDEDRPKACVVGLHEVARPGDVIVEEGRPGTAGSAPSQSKADSILITPRAPPASA